MNIYSKDSVLIARSLRQLNGLTITLFDGLKGKINYPYAIMMEEGLCRPINIEVARNFTQIKSIKNGTVEVATRKNPHQDLITTGKGIPLKQRY